MYSRVSLRILPKQAIIVPFRPYSVAVVGAGPAGFYTAKYLTEGSARDLVTRVDILEKLPVPYGLVRFGVAPDHEQTKSVMTTFDEVAGRSQVRYLGNIPVGREKNAQINVEGLLKAYDAVVLAHGASSDAAVGCPGEELRGVISARRFVNWYNGHPDFAYVGETLDLPNVEDVVIVGQGNVAIDCARLLAKARSVGGGALNETDLTDTALATLQSSGIRRVTLVARRSHVQAACTIKELRELSRLPGGPRLTTNAVDMDLGDSAENREEAVGTRPRKRLTDLLEGFERTDDIFEGGRGEGEEGQVDVHLRYLLQPTTIRDGGSGGVKSVQCTRSALSGPAGKQRVTIASPQEDVDLPAQLVITSVGYKCEPMDGVPFDHLTATVPSSKGRVLSTTASDAPPVNGLYVAGWLKRGPTGTLSLTHTWILSHLLHHMSHIPHSTILHFRPTNVSTGQVSLAPIFQMQRRLRVQFWQIFQRCRMLELHPRIWYRCPEPAPSHGRSISGSSLTKTTRGPVQCHLGHVKNLKTSRQC